MGFHDAIIMTESKNNTNAENKSSKPEKEITEPTIQDLKDWKHMQGIMRHISHVQQGAALMSERLFDRGDATTARLLVQKVCGHDASKFIGIEWEHLRSDADSTSAEFQAALKQHQLTNDHHPEYWGSIKVMPPLCLAEMTCDWYARSTEFGTDLRDWVKNGACQKYGITTKTKCYKEIKSFVDILLDNKFK